MQKKNKSSSLCVVCKACPGPITKILHYLPASASALRFKTSTAASSAVLRDIIGNVESNRILAFVAR